MNMKRFFPVLFCLILVAFVVTAGCVSEDTNKASGPDWLFSDISGEVTPETNLSPVDDFHVAVNKEWLSTTQIPEGQTQVSAFTEQGTRIQEKFAELIADTSITGHDADLTRAYYNACLDWDQRNANGLKPLEKYTRQIEQIQSLDDYARFVSQNTDYMLGTMTGANAFNSSWNALYINPPYLSLEDSAEYSNPTSSGMLTKEANAFFFKKMLLRLGYTEEQADRMEEDRMWLESELASSLKTKVQQSDYAGYYQDAVTYTIDGLKTLLSVYPVEESLSGYIRNGLTDVIVFEPEGLKKLNELYTLENLEKFKAHLLYAYIDRYSNYLDQETKDISDERASIRYDMDYTSVPETDAYSTTITDLEMPAAHFYIDNAVDPGVKTGVISVCHSVIDIYRTRLANATWLSADTRAKAIEKLDAIRIFAIGPDDWSDFDYSSFSFAGCTSLAEMKDAFDAFEQEKKYHVPGTPVDENRWTTGMSTLEVNACYEPSANSVTIFAGIIGDPFYNVSASLAANLGGLGFVIGHEVSHAFDSSGSQYDKDGNLNNWWTEADRNAFNEKTDKVAAYFSTIEAVPGGYVNGELTVGEAVADLGGMAVMLEAASHIEDFDYDAFFKNYAAVWEKQTSEDLARSMLVTDVHPPGHVRTNATVQQFDEFYQTYGVKPGDGMYLAPENRLSVW